MKQKIALFIFLGLLVVLVSSYSGGYAQNGGDGTGATGSSGCNCHSSAATTTTVVELDSAGVPVTSYRGGGAYTVKISASNTSSSTLPKFGFQLATVKLTGAGTGSCVQAGTWGSSLPTNVQNTSTGVSGLPIPIIEQSTQITATSGTGGNGTTYVESIPWTAPVAGTGSIKIYGVLNAVNNNNSSGGDKYHVAAAVTITEAVAVAPVASVTIAITSGTNPTCSGVPVTFTATPTNGGTAPSYQWKVNGTNAGTGVTFTSSTLTSGQVVTCVMTSNLSGVTGSPATSAGITMTVNSSVTDSVHIAASATSICSGTPVTFTATPFNGGTPTYQWKVNGTNVATGATYTSSTLTNGNVVTCVMTPTGTCVSPATSTSNAITMTVSSSLTDSVHISASATSICTGSPVTFTATPFNGGTPTYQWKVNGTNVATGATYTTSALTNGQIVTCVMTPTGSCVSPATSTSNAITMTVGSAVTDSVHIAASATTVCSGSPVTFTATPFNGGAPTYQWKVNGTNVATGATYTTSTLTNGQIVTCVMTPTGSCVSPATSTSNAITMTVNPTVTDSVHIAASATTACSGVPVTFTATPFNGGTPTYQWKVNGTNVATGATYTTSALANGNIVTCVMTPTGSCVSPATSTSNAITMTINQTGTDSVTIAATATTICTGTPVTFTATPHNGGASPAYQWKVNGTNAATGVTFTTSTLTNGQVVTCVMTPSGSCATPATSTSNAITITVGSTAQTDSIEITTSANPACAGAPVTFTAHPFNGGTTPAYQWKLNGTNIATGATYTTSTLATGNVITCVMTPSGSCVTPATSTSAPITMTINPSVTPTIHISTPANSVCPGTLVTFTATVTNQGTVPAYQWKVNGTNAGSNSNTFTTGTLTNGAIVTCQLTSNASCAVPATITSNADTITVTSSILPTVHITGSAAVCSGMADTFSAQFTGGGTSPSFVWKVNGTVAGTNSSNFIIPSVIAASAVTCTLTSSSSCASPTVVTSNTINVVVSSPVTPTISITTPQNPSCQGSLVSFTSSATGQGTNPVYTWYVNTNQSGAGASFSSSSLFNGDVVKCVLTSSAACASPVQQTSNTITMTIHPVPSATLVPSGSVSVCTGDSVQLTAGGGTGYHWSDSEISQSIWASQAGSYDVTVSDANGCTASPNNAATISVISATVPTISQAGNVLISSPAVHYQWQLNGTVLGGADTTESITITQSGNYVVSIIDANGCSATSVSYLFSTTGINGIAADLGVRLYPIPNHGSFAIDMSDYTDAQLVVYDMYGKDLYHQAVTSVHQEISDVDLSAGLYFVQVTSGGRVQTIKMQVIKE